MKDYSVHYSILLIDDDKSSRELLSNILQGHDKVGVSTGQEGFHKFKELCPDIVFLDIGLMDVNGLTLLQDMIAYDPEIFVVMLTKSALAEDVNKAKNYGAAAYVVKPFSIFEIENCITKYKHFKKLLERASPKERATTLTKKLKVDVEDKYNTEKQRLETASIKKNVQRIITPTKKTTPQENNTPPQETEIFQRWKILFVDDYLVNQQRAETHFKHIHIGTIDIAANYQEAVEKATEQRYDTIFMDTDLAGESGYKAVEEIRAFESKQHFSQVASVVGMFESADETESRDWLQCGMNDYVLKPVSFNQLHAIVLKHIKHSIFLKYEAL